jgi:hypothetical protein
LRRSGTLQLRLKALVHRRRFATRLLFRFTSHSLRCADAVTKLNLGQSFDYSFLQRLQHVGGLKSDKAAQKNAVACSFRKRRPESAKFSHRDTLAAVARPRRSSL